MLLRKVTTTSRGRPCAWPMINKLIHRSSMITLSGCPLRSITTRRKMSTQLWRTSCDFSSSVDVCWNTNTTIISTIVSTSVDTFVRRTVNINLDAEFEIEEEGEWASSCEELLATSVAVLMFVETPTPQLSVLACLLVLTPSLVERSTLALDAEFEIEDWLLGFELPDVGFVSLRGILMVLSDIWRSRDYGES